MPQTTATPTPECVLGLKATLGEGPVWIDKEKALYFVDITEKKVHRFHPDTKDLKSWTAPERVVFLLPADDGSFLCGLAKGLYRFDPRSGEFARHALVEPEQPSNRLNDGCVDAQGRVWFGTMDDGEEKPTGAIYCVRQTESGLAVSHHDEGYTVSNGPAVSPDGRQLYVCDSPEQRIYAFDVTEAGELKNERVFAELVDGYPDGVVTDSAGNIWCAVWGGGRVICFSPEGKELRSIPFPCSNVTKVAFGGEGLRTAYVTTAQKGLSREVLAHEPLAGNLFAFSVEVPGLPQREFRLGK